jgi:tetratricopeptide (TPR) repeat protein
MNLKTQKQNILITAALATLLLQTAAYAQVQVSAIPVNKTPALADELREQGHYAISAQTAQQHIDAPAKSVALPDPADADRVKYDRAISELKSEVAGAENYAKQVMEETPNPVYNQRIGFGLAHFYFRQDNFAEAIKYYEASGIHNLDNNEIGDQKFELAYCYFNNKQFDKAKPLFASIKEIKENKYYMAGNYYYGLLCYNENKYDEALACFEKIKAEREYKSIIPYYIAEIYYFKGNRERALMLADTLIKGKEKSFYHKELHLLAAQCLFETQKYAEAKPYFVFYYEHADKIRKEDMYEIAYCHYRLDEWKSAIEKFKTLSDTRDSLGQTSMYLLGDCYLKTGNKTSARNAFGICADMNYNRGLQEAAMILYARLSYETGNSDEALRQLKVLNDSFPNSRYRDEAQTLTSGLFLKTNKYEEALDHLQQVKDKDKNYWAVYQRATYGYGVQQFRKGELDKADMYFDMSLKNPINSEYERAAYFWRGEVAYHQAKYNDAINYSQNFISRIGDIGIIERLSPQATVQHAYLNMGYSAKELGNFVAAQDYFNQAQLSRSDDKHASSVALLQEADAVFLQKNYTKAIGLYEKIIGSGGEDVDYAKFQKAILLGLLNKNTEKIALLQTLTRAKPASMYAGNARYEIAITYMEMDQYRQALTALKQITDSANDLSLMPKAWMKTGFIQQQLNDNNKAIEAYKRVVVGYPGAEERFAAMEALKGLYIQTNQPAQYSNLLRESNLTSADSSILDSTYYSAAENQFAAEKWLDSRMAFTNYLRQYPNGIFVVKAHYYLGETFYRLKKYPEAQTEYNSVLTAPWNDFSESSARRAAYIAMELRDYESAYAYYTTLRNHNTDDHATEMIYRGLMKSGYNYGKFSEAGAYADSLMALSSISVDGANEAKFYKARSLQIAGKDEEAIEAYKTLTGTKNGEVAAESRYRIGEILFKQDKLKDAEAAASETIKLSAGYDNWVGKAYMLLADVLVKQKDFFNAKALLQSIVKNTKIQELKIEAAKKLEDVKTAEKGKSKLSEE